MVSSRWHLTVTLLCVFDICLALEAGIKLSGKQEFYVGTEKVTRDEAVQLCQKKCMELVSIKDSYTNLQLIELFKQNSINGSLWTSGKRNKDGTTWSWLGGGEIKFPGSVPIVCNTVKNAEICISVSFNTHGIVLKAQPCGHKSGYICAMSPNQTQEDFYISKEMVNPAQARKICSKKCMQLIRVHNKEENKALYDLIVRENGTANRYWTTGHRGPNEKWKWSDNDQIKYFHWASTEPNSNKKDPSCIEVYIKNKALLWNDHYCSLKRKFICENKQDK